jgi:hypothetical protein
MRRIFTDDHHYQHTYYVGDGHARKPYGCLNFLFDVFMVMLTGGLWFVWIFVREMRRR